MGKVVEKESDGSILKKKIVCEGYHVEAAKIFTRNGQNWDSIVSGLKANTARAEQNIIIE